MTIQFAKHVTLTCSLKKGDKVKTDGYGYKLDGKVLTIEDVKRTTNCESGFMVKVDLYENYLDSNWLDLI